MGRGDRRQTLKTKRTTARNKKKAREARAMAAARERVKTGRK